MSRVLKRAPVVARYPACPPPSPDRPGSTPYCNSPGTASGPHRHHAINPPYAAAASLIIFRSIAGRSLFDVRRHHLATVHARYSARERRFRNTSLGGHRCAQFEVSQGQKQQGPSHDGPKKASFVLALRAGWLGGCRGLTSRAYINLPAIVLSLHSTTTIIPPLLGDPPLEWPRSAIPASAAAPTTAFMVRRMHSTGDHDTPSQLCSTAGTNHVFAAF
ncbi:hypothetical protein FKP32DRAFT_1202614 [Trametes sanguinea]|nr:hypothetical protein FKP32DRAFT_1202614 [Trametes sanguinea]